MLESLEKKGFEVQFLSHAKAILTGDFPEAVQELEAAPRSPESKVLSTTRYSHCMVHSPIGPEPICGRRPLAETHCHQKVLGEAPKIDKSVSLTSSGVWSHNSKIPRQNSVEAPRSHQYLFSFWSG